MGATVVVSAHDVLPFPQGAGHFSAYLQYVHGLHAVGCEVWWMERLDASDDPAADERAASELAGRLSRAGLRGRLIVYTGSSERERGYLIPTAAEAQAVFDRADLLLNFYYELDPELLARFSRTALVDIDPGLLQLWIAEGHLEIGCHDVYFTIGETVGAPDARFPACGIEWTHIRPPVSIEHWPLARERRRDVFTTVSSWWSEEWISDGSGMRWYENNKRASFLEYLELPRHVPMPLELALNLEPSDHEDVALLERNGWHALGGRVQLREGIVHAPAERLGQRPHDLLPGEWATGRGAAHRAKLLSRRRSRAVAVLDRRAGGRGACDGPRRLREPQRRRPRTGFDALRRPQDRGRDP